MKFQGRKNKLSEILQTDELGLIPSRDLHRTIEIRIFNGSLGFFSFVS